MSMLTPPGMGGKYRITGNRYPRMRRRRNRHRIVLASFAGVCALTLGGWGTLQLIDIFSGGSSANAADGGAKGKGGAECATDAKAGGEGGQRPGKQSAKNAELPEPDSIKVNVLNATERSGLAKSTADELKKRGFKIGKVANAPEEFDKKVDSTGLVLGAPGKEGDARLKVLGTQFEDVETRFDERDDDAVDFVIGKKYDELAKEKDAEAALAALDDPRPSPSGSSCKD